MKKENNKRRKELNTPLLVILSLVYSAILVLFGICDGFLINAFVNYSIYDILANLAITLFVGIISIVLHIILMRNSSLDSENGQPLKWYVNNVFIAFIITLILTAITVGILGAEYDSDIDILIGTLLFPLIGIISTPNIVLHVLKDQTKWKDVLYKHGNLHSKKTKDYYKVDVPVPFEKKLLTALHKEEFLNVLVVIGIMLIVIILALHYMVTDHSYTDSLINNFIMYKARRASGIMFFLAIFFLAFGIPIIAYYVSNAIKRGNIIRNHKYLAYHAVISGSSNGIGIYNNGVHYSYKYAICIGIKAKDLDLTPVTMIFIPDYVLIIPDKEIKKN